MDLKTIMLNEVSQTENEKHPMISLICRSQKKNTPHALPRDTPMKMDFLFSNKGLLKQGFKSLFCKNQLHSKMHCDVQNAFFGCLTFLFDD